MSDIFALRQMFRKPDGLFRFALFSRLTENVHILSVCADYPQISECRRGKYGHLTSKRCCKRFVSGKTNLIRSDVSSLKARESAQKSADLCFLSLASCTTVPRSDKKQAPHNLRCELYVNFFICHFSAAHSHNIIPCVKDVGLCVSFLCTKCVIADVC